MQIVEQMKEHRNTEGKKMRNSTDIELIWENNNNIIIVLPLTSPHYLCWKRDIEIK